MLVHQSVYRSGSPWWNGLFPGYQEDDIHWAHDQYSQKHLSVNKYFKLKNSL